VAAACPDGMMCAVRSPVLPLVAAAAVAGALGTTASAGSWASAQGGGTGSGSASVRSLVGPGVLDAPTGLALDASGDLYVADSGHCRVVILPSHSGSVDGLRVRTGRVTTLVGGSCRGPRSIGHPTGLAVDAKGDVFIAEASAQRVQVVRPGVHPSAVTVAGTGQAGFSISGQSAADSDLNEPTSVAVDDSGNLFIADTANCLVHVLPAKNTTLFGVAMTVGDLYSVAGTRVCGSTGQGGPLVSAELWNPVAVAVDRSGDLLVADRGDQSVLIAPTHTGTYWGTPVTAGDIAVVVGGTGSYGSYLADGLAATGGTAELNDPRGLAVGPTGALFVTDGFMHAVRVVPSTDGSLFGRPMKAGDLYTLAGVLPVSTSAGAGNGTRWALTQTDTPSGIVVSSSGNAVFSDAGQGTVRMVASR
jgi:NHL repeat